MRQLTTTLVVVLAMVAITATAAEPTGYYSAAENKTKQPNHERKRQKVQTKQKAKQQEKEQQDKKQQDKKQQQQPRTERKEQLYDA